VADTLGTVDKIRYFAALLIEIGMPPVVLYWLLVHPFTRFWRRLGVFTSLVILFALMAVSGYGMYLIRQPLLAVDFGFQWPLAVVGILLYLARVRTEFKIRKQLKGRILVGIAEIAGETESSPLLTNDVYARSRNPRYLNLMFFMIAFSLVTNYLFVWATAAVTPLALYLIVRLEEKELLQRYGDEYRDYCEQVPRFL